jgi:hypothetical protein
MGTITAAVVMTTVRTGFGGFASAGTVTRIEEGIKSFED